MAHLISAQEYRNEAIVAEKLAARDFVVKVSPVFEVDGVEYQVIVDGHHSLQAAIEAGEAPELEEQTVRDNDTIELLVTGRIDDFLATHMVDSEYRFISTGEAVW